MEDYEVPRATHLLLVELFEASPSITQLITGQVLHKCNEPAHGQPIHFERGELIASPIVLVGEAKYWEVDGQL